MQELLDIAQARGYFVTMQNPDRSWYGLHHETQPIHLGLYPKTEEFELTYMHGPYTISTGKCGSFKDVVHFLKIQKGMLEIIYKLV